MRHDAYFDFYAGAAIEDKRILSVTGGLGGLGTAIIHAILESGGDVLCLDLTELVRDDGKICLILYTVSIASFCGLLSLSVIHYAIWKFTPNTPNKGT